MLQGVEALKVWWLVPDPPELAPTRPNTRIRAGQFFEYIQGQLGDHPAGLEG